MDSVREVSGRVPVPPLTKGKCTGKLPDLAVYKLGDEGLSCRSLEKIR